MCIKVEHFVQPILGCVGDLMIQIEKIKHKYNIDPLLLAAGKNIVSGQKGDRKGGREGTELFWITPGCTTLLLRKIQMKNIVQNLVFKSFVFLLLLYLKMGSNLTYLRGSSERLNSNNKKNQIMNSLIHFQFESS